MKKLLLLLLLASCSQESYLVDHDCKKVACIENGDVTVYTCRGTTLQARGCNDE